MIDPYPGRAAAVALMEEWTLKPGLRRHMLAVEAACRHYARLDGAHEAAYGLAGLLHDFDYERYPSVPDHPMVGTRLLEELGYPAEVVQAIRGHAWPALPDHPRRSRLDHVLFACDEMSGMVMAVAVLQPRRLPGTEVANVLKKIRQKAFAAAIPREDLTEGAAAIGLPLEEHVGHVLAALRPIVEELGLAEPAGEGTA